MTERRYDTPAALVTGVRAALKRQGIEPQSTKSWAQDRDLPRVRSGFDYGESVTAEVRPGSDQVQFGRPQRAATLDEIRAALDAEGFTDVAEVDSHLGRTELRVTVPRKAETIAAAREAAARKAERAARVEAAEADAHAAAEALRATEAFPANAIRVDPNATQPRPVSIRLTPDQARALAAYLGSLTA